MVSDPQSPTTNVLQVKLVIILRAQLGGLHIVASANARY